MKYLTDELKREIYNSYIDPRSRLSLGDLARKYNVCDKTVYRLIKKLKIEAEQQKKIETEQQKKIEDEKIDEKLNNEKKDIKKVILFVVKYAKANIY
jgi:transposase-like protein